MAWYAVLTKNVGHALSGGDLILRAGGVCRVRKSAGGHDLVHYRSVDTSGLYDYDADYEEYGEWYTVTQAEARAMFTRPTRDLSAAIEESFLVCESLYS